MNRIYVIKMAIILLQIAGLTGLSLLGNWVSATWLHGVIPGSIVGFGVLFLLLMVRIVRLQWVASGADVLLSLLLLFFVPPAVGVIQYGTLARTHGLLLLGIIVMSTILVMVCAGWIGSVRFSSRNGEHG